MRQYGFSSRLSRYSQFTETLGRRGAVWLAEPLPSLFLQEEPKAVVEYRPTVILVALQKVGSVRPCSVCCLRPNEAINHSGTQGAFGQSDKGESFLRQFVTFDVPPSPCVDCFDVAGIGWFVGEKRILLVTRANGAQPFDHITQSQRMYAFASLGSLLRRTISLPSIGIALSFTYCLN